MSVSIVTGLRAGRSEFAFRKGQEIFLSTKTLRPALGPLQLSLQLVREFPYSEIRRPGRKADH
jgi:hypothetical protein